MVWILGFLVIGLAALFVYWQIVITEGVYLGQKVVTLLYDRVAHEYDDIKEYSEIDELYFLGVPLSQALGDDFDGVILDVATGTGRVPAVMDHLPYFRGQVIGLDHSAKMLAVARQKMPDLPLVQADAMRLPFARDAVAAVTSLEALEFLPDPKGGIAEMTRVLMPGGVLLTTNRVGWEAKLMPGKALPTKRLVRILEAIPLVDISIRIWETLDCFAIKAHKDAEFEAYILTQQNLTFWQRLVVEFTTSRYQKIWARKPG